MKKTLIVTASVLAVAGWVWAAQEKGGQEMPPDPKPTKEHEALKDMEGTWDYVMKFTGMDGKEAVSKGVETCTPVGGFWMIFDIKTPDMMMGKPWHGHGTFGYDPDKKKYVGTFVNSASAYLHLGEGTIDAAGKVITMTWVGKSEHQPGKVGTMREVFEKKDKDNAVMTMYGTGPDGKEIVYFTSTYTRKK
jgi:hypothetical protein